MSGTPRIPGSPSNAYTKNPGIREYAHPGLGAACGDVSTGLNQQEQRWEWLSGAGARGGYSATHFCMTRAGSPLTVICTVCASVADLASSRVRWQRGWKVQPGGGLTGEGTSPGSRMRC